MEPSTISIVNKNDVMLFHHRSTYGVLRQPATHKVVHLLLRYAGTYAYEQYNVLNSFVILSYYYYMMLNFFIIIICVLPSSFFFFSFIFRISIMFYKYIFFINNIIIIKIK